ncbi:hypothetical protein RH915_10280 [Serpentinicella sp. ANB-PHB4]|uniref:hypothetical protein n=1 Tax=Serpentinicella sp. ANB-PHB4 TaxID=3074076 RepID=UPI00285BAB40|nr:hypothetical protein [Serpentinicella sp. ANB-PHB4]MDR5659876.1 hypothetical protein [Serpentinicella sp. ANB-PHB4]
MKTRLNQKEWIEYLMQLQLKEDKKGKLFGATLWGIGSSIVAIALFILKGYPQITYSQDTFDIFVISFVISGNFIRSLFMLLNQTIRQKKIKLFSEISINKIDFKFSVIVRCVECCITLVMFLTNIYITTILDSKIVIVFWIFAIYFAVSSVVPIYIVVKQVIYRYEKREQVRKKTIEVKSSQLIISCISSLVLIVISLIPINEIMKIQSEKYFSVWIYGICTMFLMLLLDFFIIKYLKKIKIVWLESLEKEIIEKDLSQEQIIDKLRTNYYNLSNFDEFF